jgi:predicted nucleic acid-binding protein
MIILDTNVVSALMRASGEPRVIDWLDRQPIESIWVTSVTVFETHLGIALLPKGKRRNALEAAFAQLLEVDLESRILDFDQSAATSAAALAAERQRGGRPVDFRDTQIAGIALARRATLATRNTRHFADANIALINPWDLDT